MTRMTTNAPSNVLIGVEAKINRAKTHLADFEQGFKSALDTSGYFFRLEPDVEPGWYVLRIYDPPVVDPKWLLLVGDCIHNVRSALDHLMYQLVLLDGGKPTTHTQFPISQQPPTDKNGNRVRIRTDPAITRGDILDTLEEVQPYQAAGTLQGPSTRPEDNWLWLIHRLDIIDKHRLLLVAIIAAEMTNLSWAMHPALAGQHFHLIRNPLDDGTPVARFPFQGKPPDDFNPHPTLEMALNESEAESLALWHLPRALGNMIHHVEWFVLGKGGTAQWGFRRLFV